MAVYGSSQKHPSEMRPYQSYDLYGWTPRGTNIGRNLLSTHDEFRGPGKLSAPGGSFGQYSEFHKVVISDAADRGTVENIKRDLERKNLSAEVHSYEVGGDVYYQVTVGHYTNKDTAENVAHEIRGKGYAPRVETEKVYH